MRLLWRLYLAYLSDKLLELMNASLSHLNELFSVLVYPVISIKLLLQLNNGLISFIEAGCKCNHDVTLFQKQLLISVYLSFLFLNLGPLTLHLLKFLLILHPYQLLFFFEQSPELRRLLNFLTSYQHLRVESPYLLL